MSASHNGCEHAATQHSNLEDVGCIVTGCTCTASRRVVQRAEDRLATQEALERVEHGTDLGWAAAAHTAIVALAASGEDFTTDDVWDRLADAGVEPPREPRALGPIIQAALREDAIRTVGFCASRRRHQAIIRMYRGVA